jgi:hypothetical protein
MAIEDLTNQMKMLKDAGPADLELSEATRDQYVRLIQNFRNELKIQRDNAVGLTEIGYPGGFDSATQTRTQLQTNVVGVEGILATLDKYIGYLDEFEAAVIAACKRLQADA